MLEPEKGQARVTTDPTDRLQGRDGEQAGRGRRGQATQGEGTGTSGRTEGGEVAGRRLTLSFNSQGGAHCERKPICSRHPIAQIIVQINTGLSLDEGPEPVSF